MTQIQLYNLGIQLANAVGANILSLAPGGELGDEVGTTGAGGDKTKYADQVAAGNTQLSNEIKSLLQV